MIKSTFFYIKTGEHTYFTPSFFLKSGKHMAISFSKVFALLAPRGEW